MPSRSARPVVFLLLLGALLCGGNLWVTAARSLIPLQIDAVIEGMEKRREKHPGIDDVFLLRLEQAGEFEVDQAVYDSVALGEKLTKSAWSRQLTHDRQTLQLRWSRNVIGMLWTMPGALIVLAVTGSRAQRRGRRQPARSAANRGHSPLSWN